MKDTVLNSAVGVAAPSMLGHGSFTHHCFCTVSGTVKREEADSILVLLRKSLWPHGPVYVWVSSGTEC